MGRLIVAAIASLDGYTVDAQGRFDWAAPDEEVHAFVNELERPVGTYLYGRRMYDVMRAWQEPQMDESSSAAVRDYAAVWRAAEKVVYSRTLDAVTTPRTELVRDFDPVAARELVDVAPADVSIGGAELARQALAAGIVDEVRLLTVPVLVGGGSGLWPGGVRVDLRLDEARTFGSGVTYARYAVV